jgi:hypothetical protein
VGYAITFVLRLVWPRYRLRTAVRSLARKQRRKLRRTLRDKLQADRYRLVRPGRSLSGADLRALVESFRFLSRDGAATTGATVLTRLDQGRAQAYLVNAVSGQGKTTFALALCARRPTRARYQMVPLYLSAADAEYERTLTRWLSQLAAAVRHGKGRLADTPLVIIDAVNERVTPEEIGRIVSAHRAQLAEARVKLMFMFSHRHRSYAGELVAALAGAGISELEPVELQPVQWDAADPTERDLQFFARAWRYQPGFIRVFLAQYARFHSDWQLSRRDIAALLEWLRSNYQLARPRPPITRAATDAVEEPDDGIRQHPVAVTLARAKAPAPATLIASRYLGASLAPSGLDALMGIAHVAYVMLEDERTTCSYDRLIVGLASRGAPVTDAPGVKGQLEAWVSALPGTRDVLTVVLDASSIAIGDETAVRLLGALHIASRLCRGRTPNRLRGRTTYDVAAPFVPWALRWLAMNGIEGADGDVRSFEKVLSDELEYADRVRPDPVDAETPAAPERGAVPYSFYGRVMLSQDAPATSAAVKAQLFRSIIVAIDLDREQTCTDAIRNAAGKLRRGYPDPVLDQLFEVMLGSGARAVPHLLTVLADEDVLIKSQVAYLLLAWVRALPLSLDRGDEQPLSQVARSIDAEHGNLHLHYHQAELVAEILLRCASNDDLRATLSQAADRIAAVELPGTALATIAKAGRLAVYRALQATVADYATWLKAHAADDGWAGAADRMRAILGASMFQDAGYPAEPGPYLECWETALGLAAKAFRHDREDLSLSGAIIAALEHEMWIVRWWAFADLVELFEHSVASQLSSLTASLGQCIVRQLFRPDEPVGLKQQQCARVESLLMKPYRDDSMRRFRADMRAVWAETCLGEDARNQFIGRYSSIMDAPAERYLAEYFARVNRMMAHAI